MSGVRGLNRIFNLIPYLNRRSGERVDVVCRELGISVNQLLSDIRLISSMSYGWWGEGDLVDIYLDHDRIQVYTGGLFEKVMRFTQPELAALLTGWEYLKATGLRDYLPGMEGALNRIRAELAGGGNVELEGIQQRIRYQPTARDEDERITQVLRATEEGRGLRMQYYSVNSDSFRERDIDPWHCVCRNGIWYLIGYDHGVEDERIFRVDRMSSVELGQRKVERPADFDESRYIDKGHFTFQGSASSMTVRIRLGGTLERLAHEEGWQGMEEVEGKSVLTMEETNGNWVLKMLLPFCDSCEILHPPELRQRMARKIRELRESLDGEAFREQM